VTGWVPAPLLSSGVLLLEVALLITLLAGLLELLATATLVRRSRDKARRAAAAPDLPAVTILKPLRGLDDGLRENLESFCRLDYPRFELVFCLQSADDPAYAVAEEVRRRHPEVDCRLVVEPCEAGLNPKVNNLLPGLRSSRHPLVLISDSNVRVEAGYLREAAAHFADERVALVSHLVRGTGGRSLGALFENGHLNGYILGAVAAAALMFRQPLVIGKSMLLRRHDLEAVGGLEAVKDYLAEDYRLGRLLHDRGRRVVVSGVPVDTVNVRRRVPDFVRRHIRWNRMRISIAGPA
jgi:ceramide glucosyltransferase